MSNGIDPYSDLYDVSDTSKQQTLPTTIDPYQDLYESFYTPSVDTLLYESEEEEINRLSESINASAPTIPADEERTVGWGGRFMRRFVDAVLPFPTGDFAYLPEAADRGEMIADALGSLIGIPIGLIGPSILTGTGFGAPAGVALTAGKVSKFAKLIDNLRDASKTMKAAERLGDSAGIAKAHRMMVQAGDGLRKANLPREFIQTSGILGTAGVTKVGGYHKALLKLASMGNKSSTWAPKVAQFTDLAVRNFMTFGIYGQAKHQKLLEGRLKQLTADGMQSALFTVAGLPRIQLPKAFLKEAVAGTKIAAHSAETALLLGAGMGATDFLRLYDKDVPAPSWEERWIHGLSLVALHHMRLGLSKLHIKEKMESSLVSMGVDPLLAKQFLSRHGDFIADETYKFTTTGRDPSNQNRFIGRKNKDKIVDLVGLFKPKVEGEKFTLVFDDIATGKRTVIRAPEKEMLSKQFFGKYKRLADQMKSKEGKFNFLGKEEMVPEKPPKEIVDEINLAEKIHGAVTSSIEPGAVRSVVVEPKAGIEGKIKIKGHRDITREESIKQEIRDMENLMKNVDYIVKNKMMVTADELIQHRDRLKTMKEVEVRDFIIGITGTRAGRPRQEWQTSNLNDYITTLKTERNDIKTKLDKLSDRERVDVVAGGQEEYKSGDWVEIPLIEGQGGIVSGETTGGANSIIVSPGKSQPAQYIGTLKEYQDGSQLINIRKVKKGDKGIVLDETEVMLAGGDPMNQYLLGADFHGKSVAEGKTILAHVYDKKRNVMVPLHVTNRVMDIKGEISRDTNLTPGGQKDKFLNNIDIFRTMDAVGQREILVAVPKETIYKEGTRKELSSDVVNRSRDFYGEDIGSGSTIEGYELKLLTTKERDVTSTDAESIFKLDKDKGMLFKEEKAAQDFADKYWLGDKGLESLTNKLKFNENLVKHQDANRDWKEYKSRVGKASRSENKMGLEADEVDFFRRQLAPNSEGKLDNMSPNELKAYDNMLRGEETIHISDLWGNTPAPPGFMNNVTKRMLNSKLWLKQVTMPYTMVLRTLKSKFLKKWADMKDYHELERQYLSAKGTVFRDEILSTFPELKRKDFDKLTGFFDSKFEVWKDPALVKRVGSENLKKIEKMYRNFSDDIFIDLVEAGVEVRHIYPAKTLTDKPSKVYKPMFEVSDKQGNVINIHPDVFSFNPDKPNVKRGSQIFQIISKKSNKIKSITGEMVEIDPASLKHEYVRNYVTRLLSKDMKQYMMGEGFKSHLARQLVENDTELVEMVNRAKASGKPEAISKAQGDAMLIAQVRVNELTQYLDGSLPLGTVYPRTANLPPIIYLNKNGNPIEILRSAIKPEIKKGSKIRDRYGNEEVVNKVVNVYEKDLGVILDKYMSNVSSIIPTYKYYGRDGVKSDLSRVILEGAVKELGGNRHLVDNWVLPYAEASVNGTASTLAGKVLVPFINIAARLGLSTPRSGIKNSILGNVQNFSTYATINFMEGWGRFLKDPTTYKKMTIKTGALQISVHELLAGKTWNWDTSLMRKTEHLNRYTSVATGNLVFDHALARLAFPEHYKNFANLRMSQSRARHLMKNLFGYKEKEVMTMIEIMRDGINYSKLESNHHSVVREAILNLIPLTKGRVTVHKGTSRERVYDVPGKMQALQYAHLKTQGGPSLTTMPAWLTKDWTRPLSLFYRVAYNVTNSVMSNVVKPLNVDGNPFPMLRYIPANVAAGSALYWLYFNVLDKDVINRFQDRNWDYLDYFMRAEGLGIISNNFDTHGGVLTPYFPAMLRLGENIYKEVSLGIAGKQTVGQTMHDIVKNNYVLANDVIEVAKSKGLVNYMGKKFSHYDIVKNRSEEKRRQRQFEETYFAKDRKFDDSDIFLTTRSAYYRTVSDLFWSGDQRAKARTYYATLQYIVDEMASNAPSVMTSRPHLEKLAERYINTVISKQRIVPESWEKKDKGERISRYNFYLSKLTSKEAKEIKELEALYKYQQMQWKRAKMQYKSEYYFKDRKWLRTY